MRILLFLLMFIVLSNMAIAQRVPRTLFESSMSQPEGFLGIRLGNSFRYAEDVLGEPDIVRKDSLYWQFASADFEPFEAITVLGKKGKIDGFVANIKTNRIKFSDLQMVPERNRLGMFYATKTYLGERRPIKMITMGADDTYVARIILSTPED